MFPRPLRSIALLAIVSIVALASSATAQPARLTRDPLPHIMPPGYMLIEGDILVPDTFYNQGLAPGLTVTLWPNGIVPYSFNANVSAANQQQALAGMALWENVSAVNFIPRTNETNYIRFNSSTVNSSPVGMIGGGQTINMVSWGNIYIIAHELAHSLGVWHEQSRTDRDLYVQINTANIQSGKEHNFNMHSTDTSLPYDFDSIMHYGQCSFSNCSPCSSCPTITVLPPNQAQQNQIGQRNHLSAGDIAGMAALYGSPYPPPQVATITPTLGPPSGGMLINVFGQDFLTDAEIRIDGTLLTNQSYVSSTQLRGTVPAGPIGMANITVTQSSGSDTLVDAFLYAQSSLTATNFAAPIGSTATAFVSGNHNYELSAYSFGVDFDASQLEILSVTVAGTPAENAQFVDVQTDNSTGASGGWWTIGVFIDLSPPLLTIPPGPVNILAMAEYAVRPGATPNSQTPLIFSDQVGVVPVDILFAPPSGDSQLPQLNNGNAIVLPGNVFSRGDCNTDQSTNIADPVRLLNFLFPQGTPDPVGCEDSCDANDDGSLNVADAVQMLTALFSNPAVPLPAPYPGCGTDPTGGDSLGCTMGVCP
ncbi:MAG: M12 family metallopeptidase [Planctomycetota bacterium]